MPGVLIVEDQPAVGRALGVLFEVHGIPFAIAASASEAVSRVADGSVDVVVQDMNLSPGATSGEEGVALFRAIRRLDPAMPVLLMTAWTALETAVTLVREGACDYFAKPWDDEKLLASVRTLRRLRAAESENAKLKADRARPRVELAKRFELCGNVYESDAMHRVVSLAVQIAGSDVPVLITGPNGAGKEKIAEIVQANSARRDRPFLRVNAGALPDELLESELFGAEAGAYTGARRLRIGRFEAAHEGTLFLDEIGNLSSAGQMKLLRVLQSSEFERLGSSETRRVNVRLLCATNADLPAAIAQGRFREDLFFRLNVIELAVPGLKDRSDDILPIALSLLATLPAARSGRRFTLSAAAAEAMVRHPWPGNVRELSNRIQRAVLVAPTDGLTPADLGLDDPAPIVGASGHSGGSPDPLPAGQKAAFEELLRRHGGSVSGAAAELGLSRQALYRRMERLGIVLERRPR